MNRETEWKACLNDLLTTHHRKYKLRGMLETLQ